MKKISRKYLKKVFEYAENNKEKFRVVSEIDFKNHHINYAIAKILMQTKYYYKAEEYLNKALLKKEKAIYYYSLGRVLKRKGRWRFSADAFEAATERGCKKKKLNKYYAEVLAKMQWHEKSIEKWEEALASTDEPSVIEYIEAGLVHKKNNEEDKALVYFQKAFNKEYSIDTLSDEDKEEQKEQLELGFAFLFEKRGQWAIANEYYYKIYKNNASSSPLLIYKLGISYGFMYDYDNALKYVNEAISRRKEQGFGVEYYFYSRLGEYYERYEKYKDAFDSYFNAVLANDNINGYFYYRMGYVLYKQNKFKEACKYFALEEALSGQIKNSLNKNKFFVEACKYELQDNLEIALEYYKKAVYTENDHNGEVFRRIANILYKMNDFEEACYYYRQQRIVEKNYGIFTDKMKNNVIFAEFYNNLKIDENIIYYEAFGGNSFTGNTYALYKKLKENINYIHFVMLLDEEKIPAEFAEIDNVFFVKYNSDLHKRILATAKYLITNTTSTFYYARKDGQKVLNTWHGTPIKTLGFDILNTGYFSSRNAVRNFLLATHIINPNEFTEMQMRKSYALNDISASKYYLSGYPRQDLMLNATNEIKYNIKKKLGINIDKKVVLYAPTWRGDNNKANEISDEIIKASNLLSDSTEFEFIFKGHAITKTDNVVNEIDTNELLSIVDILITDYSSIAIDYLIMDKPIIYYAYDLEGYKKDRGFYFELDEISECIVYNLNDLQTKISELLINPIIDNKQLNARNMFCKFDDGNATDRVIDFLFEKTYNNTIEKTTKKNILIYPGNLSLVNGISKSFINFADAIDKEKYKINILVDIDHIKNMKDTSIYDKLYQDGHSIIIMFGDMIGTQEEFWALNKFYKEYYFYNKKQKELVSRLMKREITRIIGNAKIDTVINFDSGYTIKNLLFTSNVNAKNKLLVLHSDMVEEMNVRFPYLEMSLNVYKDFDKIICVSNNIMEINKEKICEKYSVSMNKFDVIGNIQNYKDIIEKSVQPLEVEDDEKYFEADKIFITVGRLSPEKNHKTLINAFAQLMQNNKNQRLRLLIIGDGPMRTHTNSLIKSLGLEKNVILIGQRMNPYNYLKRADCFVFTSLHEGQGIVLLEALILEKPIITTNIPTSIEIVNNYGGLLVEQNQESVFIGMEQYLNNSVEISNNFNPIEYNQQALNKFYSYL